MYICTYVHAYIMYNVHCNMYCTYTELRYVVFIMKNQLLVDIQPVMDKFIVMNFTFMIINIVQLLCSVSLVEGGYLYFDLVRDVVEADLNNSEPSFESEDHDIKIQITEEYWNEDTTKMLHCSLAAGLTRFGQISNHILISPLFYLSCETDQPVEAHFTIPHVLSTLSEDVLE